MQVKQKKINFYYYLDQNLKPNKWFDVQTFNYTFNKRLLKRFPTNNLGLINYASFHMTHNQQKIFLMNKLG